MAAAHILASAPVRGSGERPRRVAVTGSAGRIGGSFRAHAQERYALRLAVRNESERRQVRDCADVVVGDLCEPGVAAQVVEGMDTVLHLAANPSAAADWEELHRDNIVATHRVFEAAAAVGCRRVVFASSIHAVSGYPRGYQVHADDPVNPGDLYGVSKCFGEALARYTATQKGVSVIVLRIGAFQPREKASRSESMRWLDSFVSHRDLNQLLCRCVDDEHLQFAVFHALSNNVFNRLDIGDAEQLVGYAPDDDFAALNRQLADLALREGTTPHDDLHRRR